MERRSIFSSSKGARNWFKRTDKRAACGLTKKGELYFGIGGLDQVGFVEEPVQRGEQRGRKEPILQVYREKGRRPTAN